MDITNWMGLVKDYHLFIGFTYKITNLINSKIYYGRKYLYHPITKKESRWRTYKSSSKYVLSDIKILGKDSFTFEVLEYFSDYKKLYDSEISLILSIWNSPLSYNKNMGGKFLMDDDTKQKIQDTFKRKGHPMKGKVHPNKGKHINSGHTLNLGKKAFTNGINNIFVAQDVIHTLSNEWKPGLTTIPKSKELRVIEYLKYPKKCSICNIDLVYGKHNRPTCSRKCADMLHKIYMKETNNSGRNNPSWSGNQLHTPAGVFDTAKEASIFLGVSAPTIRYRCRNFDKIINHRQHTLPENIGKSWKDIGYYYIYSQ